MLCYRTERGRKMIFKRKVYGKLMSRKMDAKGSQALFIEGARRIEKSSIVEEFAKREYKILTVRTPM